MKLDADAPGGLILTDAALEQLKEQSSEGCLLCVWDTLNEEDWD